MMLQKALLPTAISNTRCKKKKNRKQKTSRKTRTTKAKAKKKRASRKRPNKKNKKKKKKKKTSVKRTTEPKSSRLSSASLRALEAVITTDCRQGDRDYQEDRHKVFTPAEPFAHLRVMFVADGHGGSTCSEFLSQYVPHYIKNELASKAKAGVRPNYTRLLHNTIQSANRTWSDWAIGKDAKIIDSASRAAFFDKVDMDRYVAEGRDSGSTLCIAILNTRARKLYVGNLGDSRCVARCGSMVYATRDHSVPTKAKAPKVKGFSLEYEDGRVQGDVAMTRSIGDLTPELTGVINRIPDTYVFSLQPKPPKSASRFENNDKVSASVVLASDGLFDIVDTQAVLLEPHDHARDLVAMAEEKEKLHDNTTVVLCNLVDKAEKTPTAPKEPQQQQPPQPPQILL